MPQKPTTAAKSKNAQRVTHEKLNKITSLYYDTKVKESNAAFLMHQFSNELHKVF